MSPDADEKEEKPVEETADVTADFEAADKPSPDDKPDATVEIESPPEKSAKETYVDGLMALPSDERRALLSDIEKRHEEAGEADALPWRERQGEEVAAQAAAASADAERERRQDELRSWQSNASAARANVKWIVTNLSDQWEKRGVDDPAPRHDDAELDRQLGELITAEAGLRSHAAITEIGNGLNEGLEPHGGKITSEELNKIILAVGRADKTKAYMGILAERVKKTTEAEMDKEIEKRIKTAVDAEAGAIKAEAMRGVQVAPEQTQGTKVAEPKAPTPTEYEGATTEQRTEWKKAGIDPVLVE